MTRFIIPFSIVCFCAFFLLPCTSQGRWGCEVSTNLNSIALIKSFSLKNEFLLTMQYDWEEGIHGEHERIYRDVYNDTTYETRFSTSSDYTEKFFSLELSFRKYFGTPNGLSPYIGLGLKILPEQYGYSSKDYYEDSLQFEYEFTDSWHRTQLLAAGGCRYLFNDHIAVNIYTNISSYVWEKHETETILVYQNGYKSIDEEKHNIKYFELKLDPAIYLTYYF